MNPENPPIANPQDDPAIILVRQPLPTQLESNQQQLATILTQLNMMNSEINSLKKQKSPMMNHGESSHNNRETYDDHEEGDMETPWWSRNSSKWPYSKVEFPKYEGGDPRGWILKAEKYFHYYQTPEDLKVDIAATNLEGDALDTFSWVSSGRTVRYWDELVKVFQEQFGPTEFQIQMYIFVASGKSVRGENINRSSYAVMRKYKEG